MNQKRKLDDLKLCYEVKSRPYYAETNKENFGAIQEALNDVGVYISLDDDELYISIMSSRYMCNKTRHAGRRKKVAFTEDNSGNLYVYKYSDIVLMMQTMTDEQICEKIGMAVATYYRHKKKLKNTKYYKSLDRNKLDDKEYLESVDGNFIF